MADEYQLLSDELLLEMFPCSPGAEEWELARAIERATIEAFRAKHLPELNLQRAYDIQLAELMRAKERCLELERAAKRLLDATKAKDDLFDQIRAAGVPPHTDFWSQSIDEAKQLVADAEEALRGIIVLPKEQTTAAPAASE
jgi:hypothetical protein